MVVGIAIAILICEVKNTKMKKIYQSAILLPFLMSMVILSYIVYALLSAENGLVNNTILPLLHIDPIQWYQKPKYLAGDSYHCKLLERSGIRMSDLYCIADRY